MGREYAAKGDAVRDALGVVEVALGQWAADAESFGHEFRAAAARYSGPDANVTADVNGVQW